MRETYKATLKNILHEDIIRTRDDLGLTQSQMAEILMMDVRSYADIDHGKSLCGTLSFVLFLIHCCADPIEVLDGISVAFEHISL